MPLKEPQASVAAAEAVDGVVSHPGRSRGPGTGARRCQSTRAAREQKKKKTCRWREGMLWSELSQLRRPQSSCPCGDSSSFTQK